MPTLNYSRVTGAGAGWTRVETPDGRSFTVKGDRAMRNNNPGNIEYGKFARSMGAVGTDGRFAVFPSREAGIRAQTGLLFGKNYKSLTLAEAISKYAPEFENNTAAYAATVAAMSGVSLDTKMEDIPADKRNAVVEAMHYVEGNTKARAYDDETGTLAYTLDGRKSALPEVMDAPLSLAQTQMRDEALRAAYSSPTRALDVPQAQALALARPSTPTPLSALNTLSPPSHFPGVAVGKVTRAPLDAIPASLTPAPVGQVTRAPLGPVAPASMVTGRPGVPGSLPASRQQTTVATRPDVPVGRMPAAPTRSLAHPVSAPKPSNLAAAPVGQVTKGPALAPAGPSTAKQAEAYGQYADTRMQAEQQAQAANAARLAEQYGQYMPSTATQMPTVATPPSVPVGALPAAPPPVEQTMPAQVLAPLVPSYVRPALAPAGLPAAPPAPPAATAYDVYSGLAETAKDNTGLNTVSAMPGGGTSVTNQYGVTTGMTPGGYQTAVGSFPSLPGIKGPIGKTVAKAAIPAVGSLFAGPLGGILGAVVASQLAKPGGPLSGLRNINTIDGPIQAYRVDRSLNSFPSAPSGGIRSATFSNRSAEGMRGISPKAAADIEAGRGGLF